MKTKLAKLSKQPVNLPRVQPLMEPMLVSTYSQAQRPLDTLSPLNVRSTQHSWVHLIYFCLKGYQLRQNENLMCLISSLETTTGQWI